MTEKYLQLAKDKIDWLSIPEGKPIKSYAYQNTPIVGNGKVSGIYIVSVCLNLIKTYDSLFNHVGDFKEGGVEYSIFHALIPPEEEGIFSDSYFNWEKSQICRVASNTPDVHVYRKKGSIVLNHKWEIFVNSKFKVKYQDRSVRSYYFKGHVQSYPSSLKIYNPDFSESYQFTDKDFLGLEDILDIEPDMYHTDTHLYYQNWSKDIVAFDKKTEKTIEVPVDIVKHLWMFNRTLKKD